MFSLILYQPEIPPNTGNIIRLCANTGTALHLVGPLGFSLEERRLRRAGLDYHEFATIAVHENLGACLDSLRGPRVLAFSTRNERAYDRADYRPDDVFLFGPETRGLPASVLSGFAAEHRLRIPMRPDNRSLNLSNAVAVVLYEAWRQNGFAGAG